ncbi:MAG: carboxypeptidase-like regulatory domain-containing protein [Bacteroidota bacterium]
MKKSFQRYLALCTLLLVTILACQKEHQSLDEITTATTVTPKVNSVESEQLQRILKEYKGKEIKSNFIGRVIDENNQPIPGAVVTLGNQQETTDANGIVVFLDAIVNSGFAYAQASATGYSNGSRVMLPVGNNTFTIKLFSLDDAQFIDSSGGKVSVITEFDKKATVKFGSGFVDENGNPYAGNVAVYVNYLDPLNEDTANTMPGELYGIDASLQPVALGSYGMINVELRGTAGEVLQITSPAQIRIPIHPGQAATAAPQVPIWSFNEDVGVWVEEGVANNNGSHYVAQVNHFSFWNCDAPFPVVNFNATVVQSGTLTPLADMLVTISYSTFARSATTNTSGQVSGKIPSNQTLTITVTDPCGTVVHTGTYGPYTGPTSLTIPVTLTLAPINISGTVVDCFGAPVTNGYVTYTNTSGQYLGVNIVTAGTHSYTGIACTLPLNAVIDGVDNNSGQAITTTTVTANPTAIANLVACGGTPTEYIRYSVNGGPTQYDILSPGGGIQAPNFINIHATNPTSGTYIYGNTITVGTYPYDHTFSVPALAFEALGDANGINSTATTGIPGAITFTITNVGPVGAYIDIFFTGNYIDRFGVTRSITGDAHIIRDY